MPKFSDIYASKYVNAAQLGTARRTAAIFSADAAEVGQARDRRIVLSLTAANGRAWPQRVVLNPTNGLRLVAAFGEEYPDWAGKRIEIWAEPVQYQGKLVQGIHIEPLAGSGSNGSALPAPAAAPAPQPSPAPAPAGAAAMPSIADELDDEIPF